MKLALVGTGRMGGAIEQIATERGHRIVHRLGREDMASEMSRDLTPETVDVAIEFTRPEAADQNVRRLLDRGLRVVSGTTGWRPSSLVEARRGDRGHSDTLLVASNFSIGMNLFYRVVAEAARLYGQAALHTPAIFERHHAGKRDQPSGTALRLAETVATNDPRRPAIVAGDIDGKLPAGALHVCGVRVGREPGAHSVIFDGAQDVIELSHRAVGRDAFAYGAVIATEWLVAQRPGYYGFDDVLDDSLGQ